MHFRTFSNILIYSVFLVILTTACGGGTDPDALDVVKVGINKNTSYSPIFIADAEGYFAEQGIELEYLPFAGSAEAVIAFNQGDLDVSPGLITNPGLINAMREGEAIKIVADRGKHDPSQCSYWAFLVRTDLFESGEITSAEDLANHAVVGPENSTPGYWFTGILASANLTWDDVEPVDVPRTAYLEALQEGAADVIGATEPDLTNFVKTGAAVALFEVTDYYPNDTWGAVFYGKSFLVDNPELGRRFMVAYLQGVRQYNEGKTERNLDILTEALGFDREVVAEGCWPTMAIDGNIDLDGVMKYQDWALELGLLETAATVDQLWDPSFVDYANSVLP